ncbi:hypothetical protein D3C86_793270 [compost metagenome]
MSESKWPEAVGISVVAVCTMVSLAPDRWLPKDPWSALSAIATACAAIVALWVATKDLRDRRQEHVSATQSARRLLAQESGLVAEQLRALETFLSERLDRSPVVPFGKAEKAYLAWQSQYLALPLTEQWVRSVGFTKGHDVGAVAQQMLDLRYFSRHVHRVGCDETVDERDRALLTLLKERAHQLSEVFDGLSRMDVKNQSVTLLNQRFGAGSVSGDRPVMSSDRIREEEGPR